MATTPSVLRSDRFLWYLRLLQGLFVLIVLGVTGSTAHGWVHIWGCSVPHRLAWNVACACLTLFLMLYLIPTTGPLSKTSLWNRWAQLLLDFIFFIFWITAAATTVETCSDLCGACGVGYAWSGNVGCKCEVLYYNPYPTKRDAAAAAAHQLFRREFTSAIGSAEDAGKAIGETLGKITEITLKKGFDGALVFLFAMTLLYDIVKFSQKPGAPALSATEMKDQRENVTKAGEIVTETAVPDL